MFSASCIATIVTIDTTPPTIECEALMTIEVDNICQATIPLLAPTTSDNCERNITINQFPVSSIVTIRDVIINQTVTDSSGNINSCQTILRVVDNIIPEISCVDSIVLDGQLMSNLTEMINYTDNCNVKSVVQSIPSDTMLEEGEHPVSVVITDQSGNT